MGLYNRLDEAIKAFMYKGGSKKSDKVAEKTSGEGIEFFELSKISLGLESFYTSYINKDFQNENGKIKQYKEMARMPEIADVIEDACNESTQEDEDDNIITLEIKDDELAGNKNVVKNLEDEFN